MAFYYEEPSRTFSEYLLVPGYSSTKCVPSEVSLKTPLVRYKKGEEPALHINIPMVSAIMQSVSDDRLAIALAQEGGLSFIYGSQTIAEQAAMVNRVKRYRAGFVVSDSNVSPEMTLEDVLSLTERTGHSTIAVTEDGGPNGRLLGIVTNKDYRVSRMTPDTKVKEFMTQIGDLVYADEDTTLKEANDTIWEHKINCLPLVNKEGQLVYLVFRKDYDSHKKNENELIDSSKRYMVGAGINTRDYEERVPALLEAGADVLCIDSSEGFSEWQKITIDYIRKNYGQSVKVGAGNVVDAEGFRFLAEAGADFIKVGIGGGAICITREQKGIGRGQATSLIEVARARDAYYEETGIYVPICSDGGIVHDYHVTLALAMGADGVQMGTRFLATEESDFCDLWKKLVVDCPDGGTLIARGFVGPARWLRTPAAQEHAYNTAREAPGSYVGVPDDYSIIPVSLLKAERAGVAATYMGDVDKAMAGAGECSQRITDIPKTKDLVEKIMADTETIISEIGKKYLA